MACECMEDRDVVALARERGTAFEVCVTSNYQTGVVPLAGSHPLMSMLEAGVNVTINTDDPSISRITLSHEYRLPAKTWHMPKDALEERIVAAAQAGFLPEEEKEKLVHSSKRN